MKSIVADILEGLSFLHKNRKKTQLISDLVHMDLKLANIYCQKEVRDDKTYRKAKLGDLGLVHRLDIETRKAFVPLTCGTAGFKAPEVKDNSYVTEKADMWSLGIVVY
jgi:serine/threonine protein kinase